MVDGEEPPLLSVEGLCFAHDPSEPRQLDHVSVVLRKGRTLGILGANECGKTTLGQLLLGRLAPAAGTVLIDGEPLQACVSRPWWVSCVDALLVLTLVAAVPLSFAWHDLLDAALAQVRSTAIEATT